jgi:ribosomal protein S18 acetylase RimI-like enzyme
VRFVGGDAGTEVSIVIAPEHRGKGLGRSMLIAAYQEFQRTNPGVTVRAYVRAENQASHALFRAAGYVVTSTNDHGSWYEGGSDA